MRLLVLGVVRGYGQADSRLVASTLVGWQFQDWTAIRPQGVAGGCAGWPPPASWPAAIRHARTG